MSMDRDNDKYQSTRSYRLHPLPHSPWLIIQLVLGILSPPRPDIHLFQLHELCLLPELVRKHE